MLLTQVQRHGVEGMLVKRPFKLFEALEPYLQRVAGAALAICLLIGATGALAGRHNAEVERGARLFKLCVGCHALKPGKHSMGPSLAGLYGRRAGAVKGYRFSKALRQSGLLWNDTTLDGWLANPGTFVPKTWMLFPGIANPRDRAALIAFLKIATRTKP